MDLNKNEPELVIHENNKGGKYRWVTVTTLLLAIGAILHLVSPSIGGVTPNWTIAMYCIAINLTKPTIKQGIFSAFHALISILPCCVKNFGITHSINA